MSNKRKQLIKIVLTAVLIAMNVVLERVFAFQIESNHISLSIITLGFAAVYLGVPYTVTVAVFGDIIGGIIAPTGPYFLGFTISNAIMGVVIGIFLSKKANLANITVAVVINKVLCTLILNSIFVSVLYKGGFDAYPAYMVTRIPQAVVMTIVEIVLLTLLFWEKSSIRKLLDKNIKI